MEHTDGARICTRIIEKPVEEHVRLREEHANVNRTATDFAAFKAGEISVTEQSEHAIVSKKARVVTKISIDKTATEREETVRNTVRNTDVEVEKLGNARTDMDQDADNSGMRRDR